VRITHCFVENLGNFCAILGNFDLIYREFLVNICGNPGDCVIWLLCAHCLLVP